MWEWIKKLYIIDLKIKLWLLAACGVALAIYGIIRLIWYFKDKKENKNEQ